MKSNHTPGPWVVHPIRAEVHAPVIGEDGELLPVCKLLWPTTQRTEVETLANAELIAAAPDLLAALESIVSTCNVRIDDPRAKHFDSARAAIAKAKGK